MKFLKENIILFFIVLIAFVLRTYNISVVPPALSWDEVSIGYNAYSILKTGMDEHGKFLPFDAFAAYGDYKPPLSIYVTVPFVALFGLTDFAVRFPSSLCGTLTVLMTFFLVRELMKKTKYDPLFSHWLPLISATLLAISPWHVNISRAGFEANIALFLVTVGTVCVLHAREKPRLWFVAWIPFVLSMYTFNSARYFVFIFSLGLVWYCWSNIKNEWKKVVLGILIAGIIVAPLLPHLLSKEARLRFVEVNIFTDGQVVQTANERIAREDGSIIGKIVNNRRVGYARSYLLHFFDNLQPDFLFIKGDGNPKFSIQDVGQLYIMEAPFLVIGIFTILLVDWKTGLLLLYWIIASIIPAATARETPHALRILNSLPTWQIFIGFGLLSIGAFLRRNSRGGKKVLSILYYLSLGALYGFCMLYYLHNYYRHYPIEYSGEWQYGYREAIRVSEKIKNNYDQIVLSESIGRPYMYTLFYTKTDPRELLQTKDATFDAAGFYHVYGFGKYRFGGTIPSSLAPRTLYMWDPGAVPKGARIIETIRLLNGSPVLEIFDNGEGSQ